MKIEKYFVLFISIITLVSCSKSTGPDLPDVTTTGENLSNFQTIIADYDSVVFKNNDDLLLLNKDVKEIVLIDKDGEIFEDLKIIEPNYTKVGNNYRLEFEITTNVAPEFYIKHYGLKFNMVDGSYVEIDKTANLYKYPYKNAEIFLTKEEVESFAGRCQDISVKESKVHFFMGGGGLPGEYDLTSKATMLYPDFGGGDFMTANETYAFYNGGPIQIVRYNIEKDSVDITFFISSPLSAEFLLVGLAIYNSQLYVLYKESETRHLFLAQMSLDFEIIKTYDLESDDTGWPIFLSISSDIAFFNDYINYNINRFDLSSNSYLEPIKSPTLDFTGMDFYNGRFYYSDWNRKAIFSIPLSDLMD